LIIGFYWIRQVIIGYLWGCDFMECDVLIIGAGPAGLFAASELASHFDVMIVDKGRDMDERSCIALKNRSCQKCEPCNITGGVGGAGGLSDGKLNLRPDIGGDLEEFVSSEDAWKIIGEIDQFFLMHGAQDDLYSPVEEEISDILRKSAASGIKFLPIAQRHMGSDKTPAIIESIKNELESKGVKFLLETEILDILVDKSLDAVIARNAEDGKFKIGCSYIIAAPGRVGAYWLSDQMNKLKIPIKHNPVDIGVRIELPQIIMNEITQINWDPKFHIITKT
jgi:hypothetical protein